MARRIRKAPLPVPHAGLPPGPFIPTPPDTGGTETSGPLPGYVARSQVFAGHHHAVRTRRVHQVFAVEQERIERSVIQKAARDEDELLILGML